ncbi:MAG: DUF86 domain-containing protein [Prevotellaceae bacterium]|jgi:uncharacterized protein with HEPN domain|nr:DUF86 domain-containing protein [Prevotellaceae bacterium]
MREKPRDIERLQHIQAAVDDILEFVESKTFSDFQTNKMLRHAVYRNLTIIGEAANLLTKEYRDTHSFIEWAKIIGMRHVLVHGYYEADDNIVWRTITTDLPLLRKSIASLI